MLTDTRSDQRGAGIRVRKPVQYRVAADHAHHGLNIHRGLAETERHQAQVAAARRLQGHAGSHVNRSERHVPA